MQNVTSISTTHLTKIQIDSGDSEPFLQMPYAITINHYNWVKNEINKLLDAQVIHNHSSWSATIIVVPKGYSRKHLVIDYRALNKVT